MLCSNSSAVRVVRGVCELCHDYTGLCLHLYALKRTTEHCCVFVFDASADAQ